MDPTEDKSGSNVPSPTGPDGQPQYAQPPYAPPQGQPPYGQTQYAPPQGQPRYPQPQYPQPPYGQPQGTVVPIPPEWAAGVYPIPVALRSRKRWVIAGAVVLCVALASAGLGLVLSGAAGAKSLTASVAPKDALMFVELRTDLPGDQHASLADFMSHFPGFADRSQFDNALDETLNRLTSSVSPDLTYTSAFKPWMEGEVSIAVSGLAGVAMADAAPLATSGQAGPGSTVGPSLSTGTSTGYAVAIFALKDRTAAQSWLSSELSREGLSPTSQDYAGTNLYTLGSSQGSAYLGSGAYAFTDQDLILGTVDGVKAALDTRTKGSLADDADYQAAMKTLSGDSLARFYVNTKAYMAYIVDAYNSTQAMPGGNSATFPLSDSNVPAWIAGSIHAESSALVVDLAMPRVNGNGNGNHTSTLASMLPGNTVGVVEVHSIGQLVTKELAAVQSAAPGVQALATFQTELAAIGGVDWLGDGVAVVTKEGSSYDGGLVAQATDAATASAKVALVTNLLALGGASYQIKTHTDSYNGTTITIIGLPSSLTGTATELALAAKGDLIVGGYSEAFVKAVIDTTPSTSLSSQSDYSAVMATAGSSNEGSFYVDVPALEDAIGQAVFAADPSMWASDYKPYFDHLGGVGSAVVDGDTVILRFVATAR